MNTYNPANENNRATRGIKTTLVSLCVNTLLAVIKILTGILGNSYALIADGVESTMDIFSSTVVLSGIKIGATPADENHPYGHGKAESLAALVVSLALIGVAIGIAIQSVREILAPHHRPAAFTLIVLVGVVLIKEWLFHFIFKASNEVNSLSLKVDAWHSRSDALTSLAAFIGISIALIFGKGYENADDWAALFASGVIAFNGIVLSQSAIAEIMDAAPGPEIEEKVRAVSQAVSGVIAIEKCRIRKSGLGFLVDIHVEVDEDISVRQGHDIAHNVKDALLNSTLGVKDVLVHIEPAANF